MTAQRTAATLGKTRSVRVFGYGCGFAKALALLIAVTLPTYGFAMPTDPQRPFEGSSCADAKMRFREALTGSPLISKEEMKDVVARAREWTERLCGSDIVQEIQTEFKTKDCAQSN
ncbi:MAG: hypothetical protein ACSHWS_05240 [Sulfitobacter sp.]